MKTCTKCGIEKEATTENFHRHRSRSDGLASQCKVCACESKRISYLNPEIAERQKAFHRTTECKNRANKRHKLEPRSKMFIGARHRAKRGNIPFNIAREDIFIPKSCPVLGIPLKTGQGKFFAHSPSLDRVEPAAGYIKGNVWVISHRANQIKNDGTLAEFRLLVSAIEAYASGAWKNCKLNTLLMKDQLKALLTAARHRSKKKRVPFDIALEDVFIPEYCPVLGIPLFLCQGKFSAHSPSLGTLDHSLGYVKGNVWVTSYRANLLKRDGTLEELKQLVAALEAWKTLQSTSIATS